jgi:hypothetical protein
MLRISFVFAFVAVAMAQNPASERQIMAGSGHLKSGPVLAFRSMLTPAGTPPKGLGGGGIWTDANTMHRYMIDRSNRLYFGYDLVLGTRDATGGYMATFQPLSQTDHLDSDEIAGMKFMMLAKYPAPQLVHDEDTIAVDLMVSPDGSQRLTDYIRILGQQPPAAKTTAEPRDFTIDDGPVTFDITQLTFWKQGQLYQGMSGFTGKPGATLWIAIPGRGRYVVSLAPHAGFTKAGTIRDNVASFADSGQRYELRFQSPIAGAGKAWNLYVMRDSAFQQDLLHRFSVDMGTDRLDNLIPKH